MSTHKYCRSGENVYIGTAMASLISTTVTNPIEVAKLNYQYMPLQCPYFPHRSTFLYIQTIRISWHATAPGSASRAHFTVSKSLCLRSSSAI
jgi:hypothetical protein